MNFSFHHHFGALAWPELRSPSVTADGLIGKNVIWTNGSGRVNLWWIALILPELFCKNCDCHAKLGQPWKLFWKGEILLKCHVDFLFKVIFFYGFYHGIYHHKTHHKRGIFVGLFSILRRVANLSLDWFCFLNVVDFNEIVLATFQWLPVFDPDLLNEKIDDRCDEDLRSAGFVTIAKHRTSKCELVLCILSSDYYLVCYICNCVFGCFIYMYTNIK